MKYCMTTCLSQRLSIFQLFSPLLGKHVPNSWKQLANSPYTFLEFSRSVAVSIDYTIDWHISTLQIRLDLHLPISLDQCIPNWKSPTIEDCFQKTKLWWRHAPNDTFFFDVDCQEVAGIIHWFHYKQCLVVFVLPFLEVHVTFTLSHCKKFTQVD